MNHITNILPKLLVWKLFLPNRDITVGIERVNHDIKIYGWYCEQEILKN